MIKTILVLALITLTTTAFANDKDFAACEAQLPALQAQLSTEHAYKLKESASAVIVEAYADAGIKIDPSQIQYDVPSSSFSSRSNEQISTEILAKVNAGVDSIQVRVYGYSPFYFNVLRQDETDKLGRVVKTELVCEVEGTFYDSEVYNHDSGHMIGQAAIDEDYRFQVVLP